MSTALQKQITLDPAVVLQVIAKGDLSKLTDPQRVDYVNAVCQSIGLNPLTQPFEFIELPGQNGTKKLTLYAKRTCTDQLRYIHNINIYKLDQIQNGDTWEVTAYAETPDGRRDADTGVVYIKGLVGDSMANAKMKAITKAKRRVTLSICGLGWLDESEIDSIRGAKIFNNDSQPTQRSIGLDQWKCTRQTAMDLLGVCKRLEATGVTQDEMRQRLPDGIQSRKDLSEEQAQTVIQRFSAWLQARSTGSDVIEGEVVNDLTTK